MMFKNTLHYYNRAMWRMSIAKGELAKPLQFSNETIWIATLLAVKGIDVSVLNILIAYIVVFISMILIGEFLIRIGVLQYMNSLGNSQNLEMMAILKSVKQIELKVEELQKTGK